MSNNYNQEVGLHGLGYQVKRFLDVADAEPPAYYPLLQTTKYIQRGQIQMGKNKNNFRSYLRILLNQWP